MPPLSSIRTFIEFLMDRAKKEAIKPATLAQMSDNKYNRHGYKVGDFSEVSEILTTYTKLDQEQLLKKLENEATTLYELSYGLYFLAMRFLQAEEYKEGLSYLRIAADQYLNPLAMVKLARAYYHGAEKMNIPPDVEMSREQDLVSAYYYITLAFEIGGVITESYGKNQVLDIIVNSGLALLDTFNLPNIKKKLEADSANNKLQESVPEKVRIYRKMYQSHS